MNPSTATATATDPQQLHPPQPPQPHRPSTSCPRHPEEENFTGFCPSCLCERLAILDHTSSAAATSSSTSSRKPLLASAALRAIFKPSSSSTTAAATNSSNKPSFFPELRRSKSFSASKNEGFSGVFEPQRKSCDVRGRNTLWLLFNQANPTEIDQPQPPRFSASGSLVLKPDGFEGTESDQEEEEEEDNVRENTDIVVDPPTLTARNSNAKPIDEIIEEEDEHEEEEEIAIEPPVEEEEEKTMKDHLDLDSSSQTKKRVSFWSAASVFSKKLQKWRQKQKLKKRRSNGVRNGGISVSGTLPVEKPIGRQYRETQSEIADYGFGRRSCDTDPRFSLDIGRMSFDDPRYSFDEPRASWDGYLMGRTFPTRAPLLPTMLSVVEDAPAVIRSDAHIPVEQPPPPPPPPPHVAAAIHSITEDEFVPGGCAQTRDYYTDSSSRRRKSLDRSSSIRSTAAAVVAEIDELKSVSSNSKVSPATVESSSIINGPKVDYLREYSHYSNSLRDDCSVETFDNASIVGGGGGGDRKENNGGGTKKSKRWGKGWSIWGFIHRRSVNKDDERSSYRGVGGNGVERSFSETWPDLRGERMMNVGNGGGGGGRFNPNLMRSSSSVSWRNSNGFGPSIGSFGSGRKSNVETCSSGNGFGGRKKRDEFMLERNRSARYSPSNNSTVDNNGMLKWYLAPQSGTGRIAAASATGGGGGWGKSKTHQAHSIARSVLRLY